MSAQTGEASEASFPTTDLGHCLVTGGAGYLGRHLAKELLDQGHKVRVFDLAACPIEHENLEKMRGDITQLADVRKACEGIDTIFHVAAVLVLYSFSTKAQRDLSYGVNVQGVKNIIEAAKESGVQRLVHTSSNNVTFGDPVVNGDETWPYAENPKDLYTETKIIGEKLALAANDPNGLLTCAIRPGGIYGPGDQFILRTVVEKCADGLFTMTVGDGTAMSDNSYIVNLVDGHIEAARHLLKDSLLPGEAYFITDGNPINYFEFFKPLVEGIGYKYPKMSVPTGVMVVMAYVWEFLHWAIKIPKPLLTRLEVRKIAYSHYSRIDKAKRDFGWYPKVSQEEAYAACIPFCQEVLDSLERVDRPHIGWWISILGGMTALGVLAFNAEAYAAWDTVIPWTPRFLLQAVFFWAVLVHVYKGMKAAKLAAEAGLSETAMGWGWQTFFLGFPSLGLLDKKIQSLKKQ